MQAIPPALEALIREFSRLPGIGKKSATRLALYVLRRPEAEARRLAESLLALHVSIRLCSSCYSFSEHDPCGICADHRRDRGIVCVVEGVDDMLAVEKSGAFHGLYHVLHGTISPLEGVGPDELKIKELVERVRQQDVREVLLATSSTVPGDATASYLIQLLQNTPIRLTRLACGIPLGMDIKFADTDTLKASIDARRDTAEHYR